MNRGNPSSKKVEIVPWRSHPQRSPGSFAKRFNGVEEGIVFDEPTFEFLIRTTTSTTPCSTTSHASWPHLATRRRSDTIARALALKVQRLYTEAVLRGIAEHGKLLRSQPLRLPHQLEVRSRLGRTRWKTQSRAWPISIQNRRAPLRDVHGPPQDGRESWDKPLHAGTWQLEEASSKEWIV